MQALRIMATPEGAAPAAPLSRSVPAVTLNRERDEQRQARSAINLGLRLTIARRVDVV